ncbi:MAG: isoprenylcysteine carboxylmethyltransferase family protein [Thauera sp.]|jgi:protein-S-isoprenylcysteine O-methyltransferase Ste14|nr:isoprenylcysteine carboxylmethyltransferase family protein [Thauera sp.]
MAIWDRLELKLPPPLVALLCALSAWGLSVSFPTLQWAWGAPRLWLMAVLGGAGLLLDLSALSVFLRMRTTLSPFSPARTRFIVRGGPYRLSRNPMYLGLTCVLSALAVYLAHPLAWLAPLLFVAWISRFQIRPEERILLERFGEPYAHYLKAVRRWL